jgi:hypothetical protein
MPDPSGQKAFLEVEGTSNTRIPCMFNPAELEISRSNGWVADAAPGRGVPKLRYTGSGSGRMKLQLFFDTTDSGTPVTKYTGQLLELMDVDPSLPGSNAAGLSARPPYVIFHWGDLHSFKAVVSDLELSFVYFSSGGVPLRARLNLTLQQYEESNAFGKQNPTSGTPEPHRTHRVQPGETLDRIAAQHYGDSTQWRALADANGIQDPLALRPGALLAVPRIDQ